MNIPIEILVVVLTSILGAMAALITFIVKSIKTLDSGFTKVTTILVEIQTANKFETNQCQYKHTIVDKRLDEHDIKLDQHEIEIVKLKSRRKLA